MTNTEPVNQQDRCLMPHDEARAIASGLRMALVDVLEQLTNEVRTNGSQLGVLRERESALRQELTMAKRELDSVVGRLRDATSQLAAAQDKVRDLLNQNHALREQLAPDPAVVDDSEDDDDAPQVAQQVVVPGRLVVVHEPKANKEPAAKPDPVETKVTIEQIVAEWRRGCSCAKDGNPWECAECTGAAMRAVARFVDDNKAPVIP